MSGDQAESIDLDYILISHDRHGCVDRIDLKFIENLHLLEHSAEVDEEPCLFIGRNFQAGDFDNPIELIFS